jgi:hypothetical protein
VGLVLQSNRMTEWFESTTEALRYLAGSSPVWLTKEVWDANLHSMQNRDALY